MSGLNIYSSDSEEDDIVIPTVFVSNNAKLMKRRVSAVDNTACQVDAVGIKKKKISTESENGLNLNDNDQLVTLNSGQLDDNLNTGQNDETENSVNSESSDSDSDNSSDEESHSSSDSDVSKDEEDPCKICKRSARYTCPGCQRRTCSVRCVRKHKKKYKCTGIRKKSEYLPVSEMTVETLHKDVQFLSSISHNCGSAERANLASMEDTKKPHIPSHLFKLQQYSFRKNISLTFSPSMSSFFKNNNSYVNQNIAMWRVMMQFITKPVNIDISINSKTNTNTNTNTVTLPPSTNFNITLSSTDIVPVYQLLHNTFSRANVDIDFNRVNQAIQHQRKLKPIKHENTEEIQNNTQIKTSPTLTDKNTNLASNSFSSDKLKLLCDSFGMCDECWSPYYTRHNPHHQNEHHLGQVEINDDNESTSTESTKLTHDNMTHTSQMPPSSGYIHRIPIDLNQMRLHRLEQVKLNLLKKANQTQLLDVTEDNIVNSENNSIVRDGDSKNRVNSDDGNIDKHIDEKSLQDKVKMEDTKESNITGDKHDLPDISNDLNVNVYTASHIQAILSTVNAITSQVPTAETITLNTSEKHIENSSKPLIIMSDIDTNTNSTSTSDFKENNHSETNPGNSDFNCDVESNSSDINSSSDSDIYSEIFSIRMETNDYVKTNLPDHTTLYHSMTCPHHYISDYSDYNVVENLSAKSLSMFYKLTSPANKPQYVLIYPYASLSVLLAHPLVSVLDFPRIIVTLPEQTPAFLAHTIALVGHPNDDSLSIPQLIQKYAFFRRHYSNLTSPTPFPPRQHHSGLDSNIIDTIIATNDVRMNAPRNPMMKEIDDAILDSIVDDESDFEDDLDDLVSLDFF